MRLRAELSNDYSIFRALKYAGALPEVLALSTADMINSIAYVFIWESGYSCF